MKVADDRREAKRALSGLDQLRVGASNILVVDLTASLPTRFGIEAFEREGRATFRRHPELSAVLLTWRCPGLRPAPSVEYEVRSGYHLIPSTGPQLVPLPTGVADGLVRPGLIFDPGSPAPARDDAARVPEG